MPDTPETLSCGHTPTRDKNSIGSGYETVEDGRKLCYPCADEAQRELIKTADVFVGYIASNNPFIFTTWTGGELGKVVACTVSRRRYTQHTSYRMRSITVQTPDGALWYGRNSDQHDVITIRRSKARGRGTA